MPESLTLSADAVALLRQNLRGQVLVTPENREAYRELAAAGLMIPLHTFAHGRESAYRMTEAGVACATASSPSPSRAGSPAPRG